MATVLLFGAGCSAFSRGVHPQNPPLGIILFDELKRRNEFVDSLDEDLCGEFRDDFERGMASFSKRHPDKISDFMRAMAEYFLSFRILDHAKNPYSRLFKIIKDSKLRTAVSTLNYDLLLEDAISYIGGVRGCPHENNIMKLHGSPNFLPSIGINTFKNVRVSGGGALFKGPTEVVSREKAMLFCRENDSMVPAMSAYAVGKSVHVCPNFVRNIQNDFASHCYRSKLVAIFGVRYNVEDDHIWGVIKKSKCRVAIVNPDYEQYKGYGNVLGKRLFWMSKTIDEILDHGEIRSKFITELRGF